MVLDYSCVIESLELFWLTVLPFITLTAMQSDTTVSAQVFVFVLVQRQTTLVWIDVCLYFNSNVAPITCIA